MIVICKKKSRIASYFGNSNLKLQFRNYPIKNAHIDPSVVSVDGEHGRLIAVELVRPAQSASGITRAASAMQRSL